MNDEQRFEEAIKRIDAANAEDPRTDLVEGQPNPRELLFAQRVYEWVKRLVANPSEELLLAARAHTIRRWHIPRERYARTTLGYHEWRDALARYHAQQAGAILEAVGYPRESVRTIQDFITRKNWPKEEEARALEDADCLVFLEMKLSNYTDCWDEDKALRILGGTFRKMTPQARTQALQLRLGDRERELVQRAVRSTNLDSSGE